MHSWVFRHRQRLRLIYGPAPPPALPAQVEHAERERPASDNAGQVLRRSRYVILIPMPPPPRRD
jgi:hypothetical protein